MANNLSNEAEQQRQLKERYVWEFREWLAHPITVAAFRALNEKREQYNRLAQEAAYSGDREKTVSNALIARALGTEMEVLKTDQRK